MRTPIVVGVALCVWLSPMEAHAQLAVPSETGKVWVYLTDKGIDDGPPLAAALADLRNTLNPRTLQRRALRRTDPGLVDGRDLPVAADYLSRIAQTGAAIAQQSRWLNAVSVRATPKQLASLASLPFVNAIAPVRGGRPTECLEFTPIPTGGYSARDFYGLSSEQLTQIAVPAMHAQGFDGTGVVIGILDTGFRRDHVAFNQPGHAVNVIAEHDFINNDANTGFDVGDPDGQYWHGSLILGCIGSYLPDTLVGGAYGAAFVLCKTEDITSETPVEEDNYVAGLEFIEFHGGDVATSSLGYIDWYTQNDLNGLTAVTTIAVNVATANGLHCCTAAGNGGHDDNPATSTIIAPADAFRVITCGAGRLDGSTSGFSSDGPTADGRVKPEVLARGSGTFSVNPDDPAGYGQASGTSLSTPLVCAAVACLTHAHPDWTVDQMRSAIFATASDFVANGTTDPLFVRGFGFLNAAAAAAITSCEPDFNGDGAVNGFDIQCVEEVVNGDTTCSSLDPDLNHDGAVNGFDIETEEQMVNGAPCP
ncbi:serine protease AprX [Phycisphaerales bacterium]|nr:serine protease AprX [Phycisphaerales bacterium]